MKILVVEDDGILRDILKRILQKNNFAVDVAPTGEDGLSMANRFSYDAVVLDIMLPTMDGWTVLKSLRDGNIGTPVLLLTARGAVEDRVRGLDLGADDYLPKPFEYDEFLARLLAIIRRGKGGGAPLLTKLDPEADTSDFQARGGNEVH